MGNMFLTLDDLYDIAIKLDPDFLFVDKRVKMKADFDRVLLFDKEKVLQFYPDGVIPTTQRAVKSILKIYIENGKQTIDIGLDNYMLPALKNSSVFMEFFNEKHYRPHRNKPWCHLIHLQPYQLLKDNSGRELPDIPENRLPTELLATIYEIYTGRKVNRHTDDAFDEDDSSHNASHKDVSRDTATDDSSFFPETADITEKCFEGAVMQVSVNRYERSPEARNRCIEQYGPICLICGFDFEKTYGELGKGFIHVHHITPISEIGEEYEIDYKNDLIPVCPNCHAMLHRKINGRTPSIPELRRIVAKNSSS